MSSPSFLSLRQVSSTLFAFSSAFRRKPALMLKWGLLLFIVAVRLIAICGKEQLHPDEVYSVMLARCNGTFTNSLPSGSYTGEELQASLIANRPLWQDLCTLHSDNADPPHASLYYMLFRLSLCGLDSWDASSIALRGGLLNLVFLILSYLLMWRLAVSLFRASSLIVAATCALAFLSPSAGDCALLVREYQLAALSVLWYACALFPLYSHPGKRVSARLFVSLSLAIAFSLSTGYLNSFFLFLLPVGCLISLSLKRNPLLPFICSVGLAACCGLLISLLLYSGYFHFLTTPNVHTARAFSSLCESFIAAFYRDIICNTYTLPVVWLLVFCIILVAFRSHSKVHSLSSDSPAHTSIGVFYAVLLLLAASLSIFLVQYASVLRESRYSYPYLLFISLAFPLCVRLLRSPLPGLFSLVTLLYLLASPFRYPPRNDYGWTRQREVLSQDAEFCNLHPNELPLLYPVLTPTSRYTLSDRDGREALRMPVAKVTVVNFKPSLPADSFSVVRVSGPLRVVIRK